MGLPVCHSLAVMCLLGLSVPACAPPPTVEKKPDEEEGRHQVRISCNPAQPQMIQGYVNLARVHSEKPGGSTPEESELLVTRNMQQLQEIVRALNTLTGIEAKLIPALSYSDPAIFALPVLLPQGAPTETEAAQLAQYLLQGGFVLITSPGMEVYREALVKYGRLVERQDLLVESLHPEHPLFGAFFDIGGGAPRAFTDDTYLLQGLFVQGRLAGLEFRPIPPDRKVRGSEADSLQAHLRFQQLAVNTVVFALTQEGSLTQRLMRQER